MFQVGAIHLNTHYWCEGHHFWLFRPYVAPLIIRLNPVLHLSHPIRFEVTPSVTTSVTPHTISLRVDLCRIDSFDRKIKRYNVWQLILGFVKSYFLAVDTGFNRDRSCYNAYGIGILLLLLILSAINLAQCESLGPPGSRLVVGW